MRSLKVLLSHPCPYPLCHSVEPPRRNVQAPKDLGMEISQGRDSWSHLFPVSFFFSVKLHHNESLRRATWSPCSSFKWTVRKRWCDLNGIYEIIPSVSVFMEGQPETDTNKIKQRVHTHENSCGY